MPRRDRDTYRPRSQPYLPITNPAPEKRKRATSPPRKRHASDDPRPSPPPQRPKFYTREQEHRDEQAYAAGRGKQKKPNPSPHAPVNELKNKIRDTKRMLSHATGLPADVRVEKERALVEYERELEEAQAKKDMSAMIKRYHFVRFLERKQATRNLNNLLAERSELEEEESETATPEAIAQLDEKIHTARTDLNYAIYSPLTEKYIALFPKNKAAQDKEDAKNKKMKEEGKTSEANGEDPKDARILRSVSGEKPPLWYAVKQSMEDGTLDQLRDGKLGIGLSGEKIKPKRDNGHAGNSLKLPVMGKKDVGKKEEASRVETGDGNAAAKTKDVEMGDDSEDRSDGGAFFEM